MQVATEHPRPASRAHQCDPTVIVVLESTRAIDQDDGCQLGRVRCGPMHSACAGVGGFEVIRVVDDTPEHWCCQYCGGSLGSVCKGYVGSQSRMAAMTHRVR